MRRNARLLGYLGIVATVFGLAKLHAVRNGYVFHGSPRFTWAIVYALILGVSAYGFGLPDLPRRDSAILRSFGAMGTAALGLSFFQLFVGDALLPRFVVFGAAILLVFWYLLVIGISRRASDHQEGRERVLLVVGPDERGALCADLSRGSERPAHVVGAMDIVTAANVERGAEPLVDEIVSENVSVLVLSREAQADAAIVEQAAAMHAGGVRVRTLASFYEDWLGKLPISELEQMSLMFDISALHARGYERAKRAFDIALALPGSILCLLLTPIVALANRVGNRGSLLYRQTRIGRDGRPFTILKFRTMVAADGADTEWTAEDDPRITPFGRLLRKTHLDELPQMWNIVRGDLSFVGPRPEQPHYVEELISKIPFYNLRHLVRPGLTGWAQVKYGYAGDERDALEKLQYDFYYLRHQSLPFDARIVGRTIRSVVGTEGR
jgi:exopolysaccharide biosynthesis polyprenyl glycosylphosphotransferase